MKKKKKKTLCHGFSRPPTPLLLPQLPPWRPFLPAHICTCKSTSTNIWFPFASAIASHLAGGSRPNVLIHDRTRQTHRLQRVHLWLQARTFPTPFLSPPPSFPSIRPTPTSAAAYASSFSERVARAYSRMQLLLCCYHCRWFLFNNSIGFSCFVSLKR